MIFDFCFLVTIAEINGNWGLTPFCFSDDSILQVPGGAWKDNQAGCRAPAKHGKQLAVVKKKLAQDDRDAEYILPIGQWIENIFPQQSTELDNFFGMAARTEPVARQEKANRYSW